MVHLAFAVFKQIILMRNSQSNQTCSKRDSTKGPLEPHLDGLGALLLEQGYRNKTAERKLQLIADLSQWLRRKRFELIQLDEAQVRLFLREHSKRIAKRSGDQAAMSMLLRYLRQSGVLPARQLPSTSEIDLVVRDYECFLTQQRCLAQTSVAQYLPVARRFLSHRFEGEKVELQKLRVSDITDFVSHDMGYRGRRSAQLMASVLRSLLTFLLQEGRVGTNLAAAVPTIAGWRLSELPRFLEARHVERILRSCDRRTKTGKRDYAILLLLARLGLRAGEVAFLNLEDIDWNAGELRIRGKGSRVDRLPLPQDVGRAIADYLKTARPRCSVRRVFIQRKAPYVGFANPPNAICCIVRAALARAGVQSRHKGAHLLRHSLATRMLGRGASLAQIGQVLRHEQADTTEIYAKVNLNALRELAQPWPGGKP